VKAVIGAAGSDQHQSLLHAVSAISLAGCIVGLAVLARQRTGHRSGLRRLRLRKPIKRLILYAGVLTVVFTALSFRVFSFAHLNGSSVWFDHLDAVVSSIASVRHGNTLLVDAASQYGLFPELIAPALSLLPPGVFGLTLLFAALQLVSMLSLFYFLGRRIHSPVVLAVAIAALTMVTFGLHTLGGLRFSEPDPVFQYWPIRFVGPALSVPIVMWAFRALTLKRLLVLAAWIGLCLFWNLDSGIAVLYGVTMLVVSLAGLSWFCRADGPGTRRLLVVSVVVVPAFSLLVYALGLLLLSIKAGEWVNLDWVFTFQATFFRHGFGMLPLDPWPDAWFVVLLVYGLSFVVGARLLIAGGNVNRNVPLLYLPLLGLGLFAYFQGRSFYFNLVAVSWPLILVAALLVDRHLLALRRRVVPAATAPLAISGLGSLLLPAMGLLASYPALLQAALQPRLHEPDPAQAPAAYLDSERSMIRQYCNDAAAPCLLIAKRQGIYTLELPSQAFVAGFSPAEMLLRSDKARLTRQIQSSARQRILLGVGPSAVRHLWPLPELLGGYRPVVINRDATLILLERKAQRP